MQTFEQYIYDYTERIQQEIVTEEMFEIWKNSICTKRLLEECCALSMELIKDSFDFNSSSTDEIAIKHIQAKTAFQTLQSIIEWQPKEIINEN